MQSFPLFTPYRTFLARYFTGKVQKLPVHIGTTCPVRDGTLGVGGCDFCNGRSFVPAYCRAGDSLTVQLQKGIRFFQRKNPGNATLSYLAYFQAGTSTYGDSSVFRMRCEEALDVSGVKGLVVSTRPDCLQEEWLDLLTDFARRTFVLVELGVESFDDAVLRSLHRGHTAASSIASIHALAKRGIPVGIHLILGLPGEGPDAVVRMADQVSELPVDSVKLHQLQIVQGAKLAQCYAEGETGLAVYSLEAYVKDVADFIERLRPGIAVERFVSQVPASELIAPSWGVKPGEVVDMVNRELERRQTRQGSRFMVP